MKCMTQMYVLTNFQQTRGWSWRLSYRMNKSKRKKQISHVNTYMWNLGKWHRLLVLLHTTVIYLLSLLSITSSCEYTIISLFIFLLIDTQVISIWRLL